MTPDELPPKRPRRPRAPRRIHYRTPYSVGAYRLVTFRHRRGYAIADESGAIVWTTPHPVTGRPMPALEPDARRALRIAAAM